MWKCLEPTADLPDEIGKVRRGRMIFDEFQHGGVGDFVDVEREGSHGDSHHRFGMVEKLYGLGI